MSAPHIPRLPVVLASPAETRHKARFRVDLSRGQKQCRYGVRSGDARLVCVLRAGHPGQHCHGYDTPSPTNGWSL